jgi:uncharacterized protein (DUF934 family)
MPLIKDRSITEDRWIHLDNDTPAHFNGLETISLSRFQNEASEWTSKNVGVGVRLEPQDDIQKITKFLDQLSLIVLEMPAFTDGRTFSQARLLKERYGFKGELRAKGDFLRDQMFFLSRVGVDSFDFPEHTNLEDRLEAFKEFSVTYQGSADDTRPHYLRG